ncbi:MAG: glycosyltransferase [Firmicutes bacterium]|jgi:trehalose synthase|nr:glycosyltransferase [Bacillota bacterium]
MFREVDVPAKSLLDHVPHSGEDAVREVESRGRALRGLKVLHLSSTSYGGGVAELLYTIVPLLRDAGIDAHWYVIEGAPEAFFEVTKKIHNSLQGMAAPLSETEWNLYVEVNQALASGFPSDDWDVVVVHDPQPAAVRHFLRQSPLAGLSGCRWFWRCHIDISQPLESTWRGLHPYVNLHNGVIVTTGAYGRPEISVPIHEIAPSIDPTSPKNVVKSELEVRETLAAFGLDPSRRMIVQVSRFDPWKDPFGVVDSYRLVKEKHPDVQLALVGAIASDDPEGVRLLADLKREAESDPDIHVLSNEDGVHAPEVAAFQLGADVVVQKSMREGFGLTITEAMWKARPVVAGRATGCALQITDGRDGFLVRTTPECADRITQLLENPELGESLGRAARETVRRRFLSTRHVLDYLTLFAG